MRRAAGCTWPGARGVTPRLTEGPGSPDAAAVAPQSRHGGCPSAPTRAGTPPQSRGQCHACERGGGHPRWKWKAREGWRRKADGTNDLTRFMENTHRPLSQTSKNEADKTRSKAGRMSVSPRARAGRRHGSTPHAGRRCHWGHPGRRPGGVTEARVVTGTLAARAHGLRPPTGGRASAQLPRRGHTGREPPDAQGAARQAAGPRDQEDGEPAAAQGHTPLTPETHTSRGAAIKH